MSNANRRKSVPYGELDDQLAEVGKKVQGALKSKDALSKLLKDATKLLENASQESHHTKMATKTLADALVDRSTLHHKDKDVRLLVAHCLTHIMRLNAPDSPYTDEILQDIYRLFASVFRRIFNATGSSLTRCVAVLETFAQVKCGVLLLDLYNNELLVEVFQSMLESVTSENRQAVEPHMLEALGVIMDECDDMPQHVLDTVLGMLLKKDENPAAYSLTQALLRRCEETVQPHVQRWLTGVIVDGKGGDSELRDDYHEVIFHIYSTIPQALLPVLPHLSMELQLEDEDKRAKAIDLLGRLFRLPSSDLAAEYRQLYADFLKRFTDKVTGMRLAMARWAREFLASPTAGEAAAADACACLSARLQDVDDKVRIAAAVAMCQAAIASPGCIPVEDLKQVAGRVRDKKAPVRREAASQLAQLFRARCVRMEETGSEDYGSMAWVGVKLLHAAGDREMRLGFIEAVIQEELFPAKLPAEAAARHWVAIYRESDDQARRILGYLLQMKHRMQINLRRYLALRQKRRESLDEDEEEKLAGEMDGCIELMAVQFADPPKAVESFGKLHLVKDGNVFKDLAAMVAPGAPPQGWRALQEGLVKRLGSKHPLADFAKSLSAKVAFNLLTQEHVKEVITLAKEELETAGAGAAANALSLLSEASTSLPALLSESYPQLLLLLQEESEDLAGAAAQILSASGGGVHKHAGGIHPRFKAPLVRLCERGTPQHAKHAVRAIVAIYGEGADKILSGVLDGVLEQLEDPASPYDPTLPTLLRAAGCVAQYAPKAAAARGGELHAYVVGPLAERGGGAALAAGIKALARAVTPTVASTGRPALAPAGAPPLVPVDRVRALIKMCSQLLSSGTLPGRAAGRGTADREAARVAAAAGLLRAARQHAGLIGARTYVTLALQLQDGSAAVRGAMADRLRRGVAKHKLGARFAAIWAMAGTEGDGALSDQAARDVAEYVAQQRRLGGAGPGRSGSTLTTMPEYCLAYAAYLVARHPDFPQPAGGDEEMSDSDDEGGRGGGGKDYAPFQRMLLFLLEPLLLAAPPGAELGDNVQAVLAIFRTVKCARDAWDESPAAAERLAAVCDLGVALVLNITRKKHWQIGGVFPGAVAMPRSLYKPPEEGAAGAPSGAVARKLVGSHLPPGLDLLVTYKAKGRKAGGERSKTGKGKAAAGGDSSSDEEDEGEPARGVEEAAGPARRKGPAAGGKGRSKPGKGRRGKGEAAAEGSEEDMEEEEAEVLPKASSREERAAQRRGREGAAEGGSPPKRARANSGAKASAPAAVDSGEEDEEEAPPPPKRGLRESNRGPAATAPSRGKAAARAAGRRAAEAGGQENAGGGKAVAAVVPPPPAEFDLFGPNDEPPAPARASRRRR